MLKKLRNISVSLVVVNDTGVSIAAGNTYTIPPQDYDVWEYSEDVITQIVAGNLIVNDGEDDLQMRIGIGLIQDNKIVVSEHYTLVEEDDVLTGNGQILYLNDEFDTTSNVPDYMDEQIEDDVLTEG